MDETARILAVYGTPEKCLQYAQWEAQRLYREAKEAAVAAYLAAGGTNEDLAAPMCLKVGEPLYDALVAAIKAASCEYGRAMDEAQADYRAVTLLAGAK